MICAALTTERFGFWWDGHDSSIRPELRPLQRAWNTRRPSTISPKSGVRSLDRCESTTGIGIRRKRSPTSFRAGEAINSLACRPIIVPVTCVVGCCRFGYGTSAIRCTWSLGTKTVHVMCSLCACVDRLNVPELGNPRPLKTCM